MYFVKMWKSIGDYKIPKDLTDQNSDKKHEENEHRTTANRTSEYDFYIKIGNVISTIGARRIKQLYISITDQVFHRRIENAIRITWQISN